VLDIVLKREVVAIFETQQLDRWHSPEGRSLLTSSLLDKHPLGSSPRVLKDLMSSAP